ncbi:FAD-dependent oxidoreductase [Candidatus Dojkabacteria bacterium]|nr:FAD-dependent oxidoreductase [Candidatus Dojkabacteria bacterium]
MAAQKYKTIIIGGGVAGLSCAFNLSKHTKDFLLITEDIGGRIMTSTDGKINYGAYYIMDNYEHINQFVEQKDRLTLQNSLFHSKNGTYTLFNPRFFLHIPELLRLVLILRKFCKNYLLFRKKCENLSQIEALNEMPYLRELYDLGASEFVREKGLFQLVDTYMSKVIYGTAFLPLTEINAFSFLQFTLPLISKSYSFSFSPSKIVEDFKNQIEINSAIGVTAQKDKYIVKTNKTEYEATNLILATPPNTTAKLLGMDTPKGGVNVHMLHIEGKLKSRYEKFDFHFFDSNSQILVISKQEDNSFLLYSKDKDPDLSEYFNNWKIIISHFWNPAFHLQKHPLADNDIKRNLFVIGDYNVCGLEDSFVTGIYAANKILHK